MAVPNRARALAARTASAVSDEVMTDEGHTKSWYDVTYLELQRVAATDSFYLDAITLYANFQFVYSLCPVRFNVAIIRQYTLT